MTSPIVPMLAALWPSADQICRVKAATEVLPLVPVTAAIVAGWRGKNFAAASASARRTLGTWTSATPSGSASARSAITATAPAASACGTKAAPSCLVPGTATNRKPGLTARLSAVSPAIASASKRASQRASSLKRSRSFMAVAVPARTSTRTGPV